VSGCCRVTVVAALFERGRVTARGGWPTFRRATCPGVDTTAPDGTADVARRLGAQVVAETLPGYGAAVHAGIVAASTPIVAVLDGDGSMDPQDLPASSRSSIARRHGPSDDAGRRRGWHWPWTRDSVTPAVAGGCAARHGLDVHDNRAHAGRERDAVLALGVTDRRSGIRWNYSSRRGGGLGGWSSST